MLIRKLWADLRIYLLLAMVPASIFAGYAAYWAFVIDTETVEMMRTEPRMRLFVVGMISLMTLFIYGWSAIMLSFMVGFFQTLYSGSRLLWVAMSDEQTPLKIRIVQYYLPLAVSLVPLVLYVKETSVAAVKSVLGWQDTPIDWGEAAFGFLLILHLTGFGFLVMMYGVAVARSIVRHFQRPRLANS